MTKLKLGPLPEDKPVKVTVELPAPLHRDLTAYAQVLDRESGQPAAVRIVPRGSTSQNWESNETTRGLKLVRCQLPSDFPTIHKK